MKEEKLSIRQLAVAAFTGGLSTTAFAAGYGWQGTLLALPAVLLAGWAAAALTSRWPSVEQTGAGRVLKVCYGIWAAALLARGLYRCAKRLQTTGGGGDGALPWIVLLLAVPLIWMALGKPAAFFRMAEICYLAVSLVALAVLVWGTANINWEYILLPAESVKGGLLAALETGGVFLFIVPYLNRKETEAGSGRRVMGWLTALSVGTVLLSAVAAGVLSPALLPLTGEPFFTMTAALGKSVRVEGLVSALWLMADFVYLGLLARCWHWTGMERSRAPAAAVILAAIAACFGAPAVFSEAAWAVGTVILWGITVIFLGAARKNSSSS